MIQSKRTFSLLGININLCFPSQCKCAPSINVKLVLNTKGYLYGPLLNVGKFFLMVLYYYFWLEISLPNHSLIFIVIAHVYSRKPRFMLHRYLYTHSKINGMQN